MATHHPDVSVPTMAPAAGLQREGRPEPSTPTPEDAGLRVPDLVGLSLAAALRLARQSAIPLGISTRDDQPGPAGHVVSQEPPAGGYLLQKMRLHAVVAVSSLVPVPDVRLLRETDATDLIIAAGLRPGHRDPRALPMDTEAVIVTRTRPRTGSLVAVGTKVDYELAPGHPQRPRQQAPDYVDYDSASSAGRTSDAGRIRRERPHDVEPSAYVDYDALDTIGRRGRAVHVPAARP